MLTEVGVGFTATSDAISRKPESTTLRMSNLAQNRAQMQWDPIPRSSPSLRFMTCTALLPLTHSKLYPGSMTSFLKVSIPKRNFTLTLHTPNYSLFKFVKVPTITSIPTLPLPLYKPVSAPIPLPSLTQSLEPITPPLGTSFAALFPFSCIF